ncbi:glycosyltransferase family protein [Zoogloea dura]|uniref:Glycosyltransferase n=1 Tax=Zoogloea dura TaxID=2728840 RepID=A0A848G174_9RHOO|nr:hypothetical protein [Zoogloea dura]NML25948.1 hypothetical protein [Zoogloea dura]
MKKKLGIVSTYDELCGIAGYTKHIEPVLKEAFDVEVFDLNQFILRTPGRLARKLGDVEIERICEGLKQCDCVNIQLEHGTLGIGHKDIVRRLEMLVRASKSVSITFHTILKSDPFDFDGFFKKLGGLRIGAALGQISSYRKNNYLFLQINSMIRREQKRRELSVIVHTRRDANVYRTFQKFDRVFHHPLSFLTESQRDEVLKGAKRDLFPVLRGLDPTVKIVGVFGFVGEYKGVDVAIQALSHLPSNYHLVIFGGVHPNSIKPGVPIDPYVSKILSLISPNRNVFTSLLEDGGSVNVNLSGADLAGLQDVPIRNNLSERVHFAGALSDADFATAIALSDVALLPYREVGQASSGPMSIANEMGSTILASRTKAFMQFEKYHSGRVTFFEQGNYLQLAKLVLAVDGTARLPYPERFNAETNLQVYCEAHGA